MKKLQNSIIIIAVILFIPLSIIIAKYFTKMTMATELVDMAVEKVNVQVDTIKTNVKNMPFVQNIETAVDTSIKNIKEFYYSVVPDPVSPANSSDNNDADSADNQNTTSDTDPIDEIPEDNNQSDEIIEPEAEPEPEIILPDKPTMPDFTMPPVAMEKTEIDFSDTLFIGDSRTVGIEEYSGIINADFYDSVGLSLYGVYDLSVSKSNISGTLSDILQNKTYKNIHIMLGINELGSSTDGFKERLVNLVNYVREYQPDAVIYVSANLCVTEHNSYGCNNDNVITFNAASSDIKPDDKVFYINPNDIFTENGYLIDNLSFDGIHCYADYYPNWACWLDYQFKLTDYYFELQNLGITDYEEDRSIFTENIEEEIQEENKEENNE